MKIALIGCCPDTVPLAEVIIGDARHELLGVFAVTSASAGCLDRLPRAIPRYGDWERLLAGSEADALIIAGRGSGAEGEQTARDEMLKRVAQAGLPALVVHPACEALVAYELDMIRRDTNAVLLPYFPGIAHPALAVIRGWAEGRSASPIGELQQLAIDRTPPQDPPRDVMAHFVRDMNLARQILGDMEKVSGLGNADASAGPLTLSVNLASHSGQLVRWTVGARREPPGATFTIGGSQETATLLVPEQDAPWSLAEASGAEPREVGKAGDVARDALDRLESALGGRDAGPTWSDACRDLEIADSLSVSLRKGRTIQLFHEEHTEEGSFKGIMAVGGCALLLLTLFVLVVFSVVEGFRMPRGRIAVESGEAGTPTAAGDAPSDAPLPLALRFWPVYPFAIFLLLQLLRIVFRTGSQTSPASQKDLRGD